MASFPRLNTIDREMFALAIPALGALVAHPLYVLADTAVVGNIGTAELGGLGLATQIIGTVMAVSIFLAYGTTSSVSRLLGAGRASDAARQAVQGLWIAAGAGVGFGAVSFALAPFLMELLQAEPDVAEFGVRYLRISVFGFPAMLIVLAGVGYLRGLKDTRRPLVVALVTAPGNLVLELILVFGFGFGVGASALSTVIFEWVSAALYLRWIAAAARSHKVSITPDPATLRSLGRDGVDLFVRTSALRASFVVAAAYAASLGKTELGAHEIAMALFFVTALALDAIAIAGQAMVGTSLGAGDVSGAVRIGRRLTGWGFVMGVVATGVVAAGWAWLPTVFTDDPGVIDAAVSALVMLAVMQPLAGVVFALDGVLIGAGDMRYLAKAMVTSAVVFLVAMAVVTAVDGGLVALWIAIIVFMTARGATMLSRVSGTDWTLAGAKRATAPGT